MTVFYRKAEITERKKTKPNLRPAQAAFSLAAHKEGNNFHLLGGCEGAGVQRAADRAGAVSWLDCQGNGTRDAHISQFHWLDGILR